ncbi:MAG TPA: ABC transporter substrate-binding protein [Stellaceae bacterium]|nr:ABC transporter substrate-binding protein [Stellaceae bacterium]
MRFWNFVATLAAGALISLAGTAVAATELRVGVGSEVASLDPHFYNLNPNVEIDDHIYDYLVSFDARGGLVPGLATQWKALDDTTWEFTLRKGVKFHDGSPFTAADVVFTFARAKKPTDSPDSYSRHFVRITEVTTPDDFTVRVKTDGPFPNLVRELAQIAIISHKVGLDVTLKDFDSGKAAIGTGPYKLVEWVPGDRLVLARNEDYWGEKPAWDRVIFKPIVSSPARTAALLAGDVDLINYVPPSDLAQLSANPKFTIWRVVSNRVMYVVPDTNRDQSPFVTDLDGKPLDKNPLKDLRVRRAISKGINRDALVERVMQGVGAPADQFLPEGFFGHTPKIKPEVYDPEAAKKLLAEAGYPNGFGLTIHGPNDRYVNDAKIAEAVAQMLTRIGIKMKVETVPKAIFYTAAAKLTYSFMFIGTQPATNEASDECVYLLATYNKEKGMGQGNRGRFSNAEYDDLLQQALRTIDDMKREQLLQRVTEIGIGDQLGLIPLYYQVNIWATRKGISFVPRTDELTHVMDARPQS